MRKTLSHRKLQAAIIGLGTAVVLLMMSLPVAGSAEGKPVTAGGSGTPEVAAQAATRDAQTSSFTFIPEFFDGGGSGPTPETAVQAAIWDAENTASGYGLFTCELVGEPQVFPQPPGSFRAFSAQVRLHCTR
jgi:hypothetical protein